MTGKKLKLFNYVRMRGKVTSPEVFSYGYESFYTSAPRRMREFAEDIDIPITSREPTPEEKKGHRARFIVFEYTGDDKGQGVML